MNQNKIDELNIYMGIDTIQIKSKTAIEFDSELYPFVKSDIVRKSDNSHSYYILNPDKANNGIGIYNSYDYYNSLHYMLDSIKLDEPIKSRIDFRFDSFDNNYNQLLKLNKVLLLLLAVKYKVSNRYKSQDLLTEEALTMRIQTKYIEAENYNKALQEPDGEVKNRLELRSKALNADIAENTKEYKEFEKWCDRLNKAVTADNFNKLVSKTNTALFERFKEWNKKKGHTLSNFILHYENCFYTMPQLKDFLKQVGIKDYVQSAKDYKKKYGLEFFSLKQITLYKSKIIDSGAGFFEIQKGEVWHPFWIFWKCQFKPILWDKLHFLKNWNVVILWLRISNYLLAYLLLIISLKGVR